MDGSEEVPITRKAGLEILACIINIESAMISGTSGKRGNGLLSDERRSGLGMR